MNDLGGLTWFNPYINLKHNNKPTRNTPNKINAPVNQTNSTN